MAVYDRLLPCALILIVLVNLPVSIGYQHDSAAVSLSRQKRNVCNPECKNGGVCISLSGRATCLCSLPYTGLTCNVIIDYCSTAQPELGIDPAVAPVCLNGTCLGTVLTEPYFNCSCLPGFDGTRCQTNIDDCAANPCVNGQCQDLVNNYTCNCYRGWSGRNCSTNINDCFEGACLNGGRCVDGNASYSCDCSDTGFRGPNCTENIDDCAASSNPCANGGTCIDAVKNYSCACLDGFTGRNCTVDKPDCSPSPCQYNGTCLERSQQNLYGNASLPHPFNGTFNYSLAAGFVCLCPAGTSGDACEINPNDCLVPGTNRSVCAHASACTDGLASFTCHCLPGYEGPTCSVDINECELFGQPCQNGAKCEDLVADYACSGCPAAFGGKNCSVRLTGCDSSPCQNNATCLPFLAQELPTRVHSYRCSCKTGWWGPQCNLTTLASLSGASSFSASWGSDSSGSSGDWTFELSFRTSLAQFDLLRLSSLWGLVRVGAHNSSLVLLFFNASASVIGRVAWPISDSLASTDWLTLSLSLTNGSATLTRSESGGSLSRAQTVDGLSDSFRPGRVSVDVGGDRGSAIDGRGGFRGCVRDLRLVTNGSTFVATETSVESGNATWGVCSRSEQCASPSPCEAKTSSMCVDVWNDFVCECLAGFGGRSCSVELPSFSLGVGGNASSASFASVPGVSSVYGGDSWTIELRLVTLSRGAFLLLLGDLSDSATTPRLLVTIDLHGRLLAQLLNSNGSQIAAALTSPDSVATGSFVLVKISVSVSGRQLTLAVGSAVRSASLSSASPLSPLSGRLIIGGFSGAPAAPAPAPVVSGGRFRRSAPALPSSVADAVANLTAFRGVVGAVRVNGNTPLLLGRVPDSLASNLTGAVAASQSSDVAAGPTTETVCREFAPCQNGATCTDVFYNSYSCSCAAGWNGLNCTVRDRCYPAGAFCPNGTECVNLADSGGYECRSAATFGSSWQSAPTNQLNLSIYGLNESLATVAGWARTRQSDCQILSVISGSRRLSIGCNSSRLQVSLDDQTALVAVSIATGSPFTFSVNCSAGAPLTLSVALNGSEATSASSQSAVTAGLTLNSVAMVTLGGTNYKGCLDNVRFNGYLAPLVNRSLPAGVSGFDWSSTTTSAPLIGCHGDRVCQSMTDGRLVDVCRNAARCTDLWNQFRCDCAAGFVGTTCSEFVGGAVASVSTAVIIAVCVVGLVIILIVAAVLLFKFVQRRRKETGTYGPSKAETRSSNANSQAQPPVRPPPEERLI